MIIYYASYKLAKEIFDSSSGLQLHDFPACSMYRLVVKLNNLFFRLVLVFSVTLEICYAILNNFDYSLNSCNFLKKTNMQTDTKFIWLQNFSSRR